MSNLIPYYGARAPEYDRIYQKPERQKDLRTLVDLIPDLFVDKDMIEVACGTGYWTQFLARSARSILAFDAADQPLRRARRRVPAKHVSFVRGDAYSPPGNRHHYQAAFAGFWFSHVPRRQWDDFFSALGRVLARGAEVVLLDNRYVRGSSTPISFVRDGDSYQTRNLDDGTEYQVLKNFPSEIDLRRTVRRCSSSRSGFVRQPEYIELEYYWVFRYWVT